MKRRMVAMIAGIVLMLIPLVTQAMEERNRVYMPSVLRNPGQPECRDLAPNGGLEADGGWAFSSQSVGRRKSGPLLTAFEGNHYLGFGQGSGVSLYATSDPITLPAPDSIVSAALTFAVWGLTAGATRGDYFSASVRDAPSNATPTPVGGGIIRHTLFGFYSEGVGETRMEWRERTVDFGSKAIEANSRRVVIEFHVFNDSSYYAGWWNVDDVRLTVCTRP